MSDVLKKPWFAALLVAGAAFMIWRTFHHPSLAAPLQSLAIADLAPAQDSTRSAPPVLSNPQSTDSVSKLVGWDGSAPPADPFAAHRRHPTPRSGTETTRHEAIHPARPNHRIMALSTGISKAAVVDGTLRGLGDTLDGGRIAEIRPDGIVLTRDGRDTLLRIWEGKTP